VAGQWFSAGTSVSSTNKTDHHVITEILLKVALNTIKPTNYEKTFRHIITHRYMYTYKNPGYASKAFGIFH
jgi:hypothetical protein